MALAVADNDYDLGVGSAEIADWVELWNQPCRYKSAQGGRGSGKSHGVAQSAVLRMAGLLDSYPEGPVRIVSARAIERSIKESVKQLVEDYIDAFGLRDEFHSTDFAIRHRTNGSLMTFPGVDRKIEAFLSIEGIDVFWMEQAESLTQEQWDLIGPSIRKATAEFWFVWNPHLRSDWVYQRFVRNPEPDDLIVVANWSNNPWWDDTGLEEQRVKDLRDLTPEEYKWKWEGKTKDGDGQSAVLPHTLLEDCVKAYQLGLAPDMTGSRATIAGLDLAYGGRDKCCIVVRDGPIVRHVALWPGVAGDNSVAARTAREHCAPYDPLRIYYDASADGMRTDLVRVGFKGVLPVNFGGKVEGEDVEYEPGTTNGQMFARRNMQMGQTLRLRANRTSRLLAGDPTVKPTRCLFIPDDLPDLDKHMDMWAQPTKRFNASTGKTEIEKADVGERSPDVFDGLCLAFASETDGTGLKAD